MMKERREKNMMKKRGKMEEKLTTYVGSGVQK